MVMLFTCIEMNIVSNTCEREGLLLLSRHEFKVLNPGHKQADVRAHIQEDTKGYNLNYSMS